MDLFSSLPPDVWSEILSYLPPKELSENSQRLCKHLSSIEGAERAAWLAIRSFVGIARNYAWTTLSSPSLSSSSSSSSSSAVTATALVAKKKEDDDSNADRIQTLLLNDTSVVGDFIRNIDQKGALDNDDADDNIFRYQDETWQDLYDLIHTALLRATATIINTVNTDEVQNINHNDDDDDDDEEENGLNGVDDRDGGNVDTVEREVNENKNDSSNDNEGCCCSYDHECVALLVGLIFNSPTLPKRMSVRRREKLAAIARAYHHYSSNRRSRNEQRGAFNTRYSLISLRLGHAGLWDIASDILQSYASFDIDIDMSKEDGTATYSYRPHGITNDNSTEVLLIDSMIYSSKFLIDRLYSQTYVRQDDTKDLEMAVYLGRIAVEFSADKEKKKKTASSSSVGVNNHLEERNNSSQRQHGSLLQPPLPPPIASLFTHDAVRHVHAKLALGRAGTLLAQHIGLGATNISELRIIPKSMTIEEGNSRFGRLINFSPSFQERVMKFTRGFFDESREQFLSLLDEMVTKAEESCMSDSNLLTLTAEIKSCYGEFYFCVASVELQSEFLYDSSLTTNSVTKSIEIFSETFRSFIAQILRQDVQLDDDESDVFRIMIQCAKDFGKTCGLIRYVGSSARTTDQEGRHIDIRKVLGFAYIMAIYQYGSYHPTSMNIERLDRRQPGFDLISCYEIVIPWLVDEYYNS